MMWTSLDWPARCDDAVAAGPPQIEASVDLVVQGGPRASSFGVNGIGIFLIRSRRGATTFFAGATARNLRQVDAILRGLQSLDDGRWFNLVFDPCRKPRPPVSRGYEFSGVVLVCRASKARRLVGVMTETGEPA